MIKKPTLLIDKARCVRNIQLMANKAIRNNADLRPHFKTHQLAEVGEWFRDAGVNKATVSSVSMAQYFEENGWKDITIAFPVNILEIDEINALADNVNLNLLVESKDVIQYLNENINSSIGIFLKIDVGTHRTGLDPKDTQVIDGLLELMDLSPSLIFKGFLAHAGHSYSCKGSEEVNKVYSDSSSLLTGLRNLYKDKYPDLILSYGDTPTCSVVDDLSAIDEIRAGNYVYYDLIQSQIGSCEMNDIAVAVECPVVALHPERNEMVIYGGGIHFSKDRLEMEEVGTIYGVPVEDDGKGWGEPIQGAYLKSISQEHGILSLPKGLISDYSVGDTIKILPVHSCMSADLMKNDYLIV